MNGKGFLLPRGSNNSASEKNPIFHFFVELFFEGSTSAWQLGCHFVGAV